MKPIQFSCPACGQRGEAQAELLGQMVTCPSCEREIMAVAERAPEKRSFSDAGVFISIAGLMLWAGGRFIAGAEAPDVMPVITLCGALIFGLGVALAAWTYHKALLAFCGPVLFSIGLAGLAFCFLMGFMPGMIAAGVLAVMGTVFLARK